MFKKQRKTAFSLFCPAISCPAFSCPAISCLAFDVLHEISCPAMLMVRHFHVRHFQSRRFCFVLGLCSLVYLNKHVSSLMNFSVAYTSTVAGSRSSSYDSTVYVMYFRFRVCFHTVGTGQYCAWRRAAASSRHFQRIRQRAPRRADCRRTQ